MDISQHVSVAQAQATPRVLVPPHRRALPLRVGTRASPLALAQTKTFLSVLSGFCPVLRDMPVFEVHPIRTTGDASQASGCRLADLGGKGLFAKEIHEALADGRIDFAVHSLKDLETELPAGIVLACTLTREDARDVLILRDDLPRWGRAEISARAEAGDDLWDCLPDGAVIGTSSVRRQAQLLHARPDLQIKTLRGNVQTRIDRLDHGDCAATLLALAGLKRLGIADDRAIVIDPSVMVPAAGQGIIGVTVRADDHELRDLLGAIEDPEARAVSTAERALLAALDGSCKTPIGGYARVKEGRLHLTGLLAREDGSFLVRRTVNGVISEAAGIGYALGMELRAQAPADVFA